jgi:hypothetical protein
MNRIRGRKSIGDQQDDRQAIDRISKSRESCHPVKKPNRDLLNMCSNKTTKTLVASRQRYFSRNSFIQLHPKTT